MSSAAQTLEVPQAARCEHCRSPIPSSAGSARFCCHGCEAVHGLLLEQGLGKYYELAGRQVSPAVVSEARSHSWLEALLGQAESQTTGELCSLTLDVQGLHCAACVWLMNETFRRREGAAEITVNPALGKVRLLWKRGRLDVGRWVADVERFGYQFGPSRKEHRQASVDLPLRLGVSVALAINVMLFSVSFYFGLSPADPELFSLFTWLSLALSTGVVAVGGWPFFKAALEGLRRRVLHLDLPIALGIAMVYGASVAQLVGTGGRGDLAYLDTLNVFICLMLTGRWLQERVLERNRRYLLEDDGAEGLTVRKVEHGRLVALRAPQVVAHDCLLVAPGDLVPVDATLLDARAQVSTDWITGESTPRELSQGAQVPAGSFNGGRTAFHVEALTAFADSPLVALLRAPQVKAGAVPKHLALWDRFARRWVVTVLFLAALGFALWLPFGVVKALDVAVALLVVTCPCAIGLAIPLAYELTQAHLRRQGFFIRAADLLDRLVRVKKVLFDKTGTLTLGRLELTDPDAARALDAAARSAAYNLAVRSSHPVSACVARALEPLAGYEPAAAVVEVPGQGVEWARADGTWRLGRAGWAVGGTAEGGSTVLSRDGAPLAAFTTREALRTDARRELEALQAAGYAVWLISGDAPQKVQALAQALGVPPAQALGGQRPEEKAATVARLDAQDTLYLGDGVNDALAFEQALAAGTPAIERPVMPGKSDFFLVGEGLSQVKVALAWARDLRALVTRVMIVSTAYNSLVVLACLLGQMSPLVAAISMPASTVTLLLMTVLSLNPRPQAARQLLSPAVAEVT